MEHDIMIRGSIIPKKPIIFNIYVPNNSVKTYETKLIELQRELDEFAIIFGEFNTFLSVEDRYSRGKNVAELNRTINQLDLIDMYRILHQVPAEYTFFSSSHGTFTKINYILGHKNHLNKFKRTNII